jgi:hypothetical protein
MTINADFDFNLNKLIEYLESTEDDAWLIGHCRSKDGTKNCLMGHVFDWGGGDAGQGGVAVALFEECIATTYMFFPINDGEDPRYQQPTARQRCIAYLKDIQSGKEPDCNQLMEQEWEMYKKQRHTNQQLKRAMHCSSK